MNAPIEPGTLPSRIRFGVVGVAFLASVLLYLDRFCMNFAQRYVKEDLGLTDDQLGYCMSGFFLTYALAQVPSGWLTDRFGSRLMLTIYILAWSLFTALMGGVGGFLGLLLVRMAAGVAQAGAYPTCASVVRVWIPFRSRAMASSMIAFGGRVGGGIAPILTALLIVWFVPAGTSPLLTESDLLGPAELSRMMEPAADATPVSPGDQPRILLAGELLPRIPAEAMSTFDRPTLATSFNELIDGPLLFEEAQLVGLPLESEVGRLFSRGERTQAQTQRLNRLILEAIFPDTLRKIYVHGWRSVMLVYGLLGLPVALAFWWIVRNRPAEHPRINHAERELIGEPLPVSTAAPTGFPVVPILTSRSLWLLSVSQFGTNVGWAFLVTWLPRYLLEVHRVPFETRGLMTSIPLWCGWFGMIGGGWLTDRLTARLGQRWGRAIPIGGTRLIAGLCFAAMLLHPSPWMATLLFALVACATDAGGGATWAVNQDVGGRYTASVLGWGNMWGNIGAAFSIWLLNRLVQVSGSWDAAFVACGTAFLIAGICGLLVDARRKISD